MRSQDDAIPILRRSDDRPLKIAIAVALIAITALFVVPYTIARVAAERRAR
jgi:hypothetical protein